MGRQQCPEARESDQPKVNDNTLKAREPHTKTKLLFESNTNQDQAQHVYKQMNDTSM